MRTRADKSTMYTINRLPVSQTGSLHFPEELANTPLRNIIFKKGRQYGTRTNWTWPHGYQYGKAATTSRSYLRRLCPSCKHCRDAPERWIDHERSNLGG